MTPTIQPPPVPKWLEGVIPPDYQVRLLGPDGTPYWESEPGPQTWTLLCQYDEVLYGGVRGCGKSQALLGWSAMGDPSLPVNDPAHSSFLNDPTYRCLLLRNEYQSMAEFVDEAMEFYQNWDCKAKDDPVIFEFKSGAKIYTNHLGSKEAYNKYRGWNLTRIGIEELTQIPELRWYLKLLGSLRAKAGAAGMRVAQGKALRKLRTQILSTCNPDGPGAEWVKHRFVKVPDGAGKLIPWNTGMADATTGLTRIFIPGKLTDNRYLRDDMKYLGMLNAQDEVTRAQWIDGDWDAGTGLYFRDYRPDGPNGQEEADKYPWAHHRTEGVKLQPWWYRWGSLDIGYDHPTVGHKFCRNESDKRIHVYDEFSVRQVGSFEVGVMAAKWWLPDLEMLPHHQITLYLSPDAFNKTDATKTRAEQIENGIKEVLGPYGAFLLKYSEDERMAASRDPKQAALMFERRREEMLGRGLMCIAIKSAANDRISGWGYMRDLLRFRPVRTETEEELKERLKRIFSTGGVEAYERELAASAGRKPEVLPGVLIWNICKGLDRCLREAQRDEAPKNEDVRKWDAEEGVGGDDPLDSCFVAGTLVEAEFGPLPIEDLMPGDRVWTRDGLGTVTASGCTGIRSTLLVRFGCGTTLAGTGNHPIHIEGLGFTRLDSVRYGMMATLWPSAKQLFSMESNSEDIPNLRAGIFAPTIGLAATIASVASERFTKKFGDLLTATYRTVFTSTTWTGIRSIMTHPISSASPLPATGLFTETNQPASRECVASGRSEKKPLDSGTSPKMAENGTPKTAEGHGRTGFLSTQYAGSAGLRTEQYHPDPPNFAAMPARRSIAACPVPTTLLSRAWDAVRNLARVASMPLGSVPGRVVNVRPYGIAPVYNLAVSPSPEYFANGILVHNCRYGLMAYKDIATTIPKSYWIQDRVTQVIEQHQDSFGVGITDPTRLAMIRATQAARYDKAQPHGGGTLSIPRLSSSRHRVQ